MPFGPQQYDANGNMTYRWANGFVYTLTWVENRLTGVSGAATTSFAYDGDGKRGKATFGSGDSARITACADSPHEQTGRHQETFNDGLAQGGPRHSARGR